MSGGEEVQCGGSVRIGDRLGNGGGGMADRENEKKREEEDEKWWCVCGHSCNNESEREREKQTVFQ